MFSFNRFPVPFLVSVVLLLAPSNGLAQETYLFSYDFQSGARVEGLFTGVPTQSSGVFAGTITVLPVPATATFDDGQGTIFTWNTALPGDVSSQVSLVSPGEFAFVSSDGSKMDLAFTSGLLGPAQQQLRLENGIQQGPLSNASTHNLLANDLVEEFVPANWSVTVVPEPQVAWILCLSTFFCMLGRRRSV